MSRGLLKLDSRVVLRSYIERGVLSRKQVELIFSADDSDDIIEALRLYVDLDKEKCDIIWLYLINECFNENLKDSIFDQYDFAFMKRLLLNNGYLKRTVCLGSKYDDSVYLHTGHLFNTTAKFLAKCKYINIFKFNNHELLYVLNPEFYKEAVGDSDG